MRSYEHSVVAYIRRIFKDANWQGREPAIRARYQRLFEDSQTGMTWIMIRKLRAEASNVNRRMRRIEQGLRSLVGGRHPFFTPTSLQRQAFIAASLTALDIGEALFPRQCRLANFRQHDDSRHGIPRMPPVVVPPFLVDRADARLEGFVGKHDRELEHLSQQRPRPKPERTPPQVVPHPHGISKADLLAPRRGEGLQRLNSA